MKKGIWLTANFFVIIIISITSLGMGIYLTNKFFGVAKDIQENIDRDTEEEIERLLYDGKRVSIPFNRKEVRRGNAEVFGLGILNTLDSGPSFTVGIEDGPLIMVDGTQEDPPSTLLGFVSQRQRNIKNNEFAILSISVNVPRTNLIGTYVLNVYICNGTVGDGNCDGKLSGQDYSDELYDGFVHKIYVKVP